MSVGAEPQSATAVVKLIDRDVGPYYFSAPGGLALARLVQLKRIRDFLSKDGFPATDAAKLELSLIPYVFQEANYDDISWTDHKADLGHLTKILDVDFLVQTGGKQRIEVTDDEFQHYVKRSFQAIEKAKRNIA